MKSMIVAALCAAAGVASAQVVDGSLDGVYGAPLSIQNTQTQFGDSNLGQTRFANGSELNAAYARVSGGNLYLMLTGNLQSNFNKLEIFIDSKAGGQNQLRGDNPNVDFNGLNRMAGLRFDAGFEADYWISSTGGDTGGGNFGYFVNYSELLTAGGGSGGFVGGNNGSGALTGGSGLGIASAINNSNTLGVGPGTGLDNGLNGSPSTGIEFAIPLSVIGSPVGEFKISAFINGGGHDFVSNQVLGGLGGSNNLGEPSQVNFANVAGDQYFVVPTPGASALLGLGTLLVGRRRR
ncbi:MAG: hypothetical protein SFZ23_06300 [Planctomycetota bacterium]|nr:hypothetical protein [Planctomycetota bacterium]